EIPPFAAATVAMGHYADAMRGMELSKSFARTLLTPLYKLIYETMRFEEWPLSDEQGQPVEGATYPSLYEFKVDINTAGDDAAQIMQLQNAVQTAAALTQIQGAYLTDQNRYEMLSLILTRADLDADKYLTNPATIPDDAAARQMQLELDALNHEAAKERLQEVILNNQLTAAK
ncbi:portal protein, partial [Herbiconiux daphne]